VATGSILTHSSESERGWQEPKVYVSSYKLTPIKLSFCIIKTAIIINEEVVPVAGRAKPIAPAWDSFKAN